MSKQVLLNPPDLDLPLEELLLEEQILSGYRIWADGTIQDAQEPPYSFMSDDYCIIRALDEHHAYDIWHGHHNGAAHV